MSELAAERLSPARAALVVVDLQQRLLPAIRDSERVVAGARTLLRLAAVLELPVVLTTQYRKGLGAVVPVGSRSEANRQIGLARMERAGALLSSVEMAAYELLGRADSAAFKQMLPHFK